jgi:hypothetical protein
MYQPDPGPLPGRRTPRGHAGQPAPRWRVIAACAACALAGLAAGILLTRTIASAPAARAAPASASSPAAQARPQAAPALGGIAPVYRLLPVTARQLRTAAALAARFTAAYCTYSAAQPPAAWLARLRPYTTATLQTALAQASTDPVLLQLRARQHTTATCTPTAAAIRDIASTAVTVIVTTRQATRARNWTSTTTAPYAVTIAPDGSSWKVYDIEPATAGQAGGTSP